MSKNIIFKFQVQNPEAWIVLDIGRKSFEIKDYTYTNGKLTFNFFVRGQELS